MPEVIFKALAENWKAIAAVIVGIVIAASLTGVIVSHYDKRVYEDKLKTHDAETAKRMTDAFVEKMEKLKKQYEKDKKDFIQRVKDLCDKHEVSYNLVLKPAYI